MLRANPAPVRWSSGGGLCMFLIWHWVLLTFFRRCGLLEEAI